MKSQAQGRTRLHRLVVAAGCVALTCATAACAAKVEDKAPEQEVAAKELSTQCHRHFRGPVKVVIEAARQHADLTAEQSQRLDTIVLELEEDRKGHRQLHEKLKSSAVAVVRSGNADSAEFEQGVTEAVRAVEARVKRNTDALEEIHAILTPDQRAAVATALRAHIDERFGKKREYKRHKNGVQRFASHLMLSKLQLEQLETIKKELIGEKRELRPSREELHALVDAFEGEDFAAALDAFHAKKAKILKARVTTAGKRTNTVLSIFTPEQRELLADLILDGPRKVLFGDDHGQAPPEAERQ